LDQRLVIQRRPFVRIERAGNEMTRKVAQVKRLAFRQSDAPQRRHSGPADSRRVERDRIAATARRDDEAIPDRLRRLDRNLLAAADPNKVLRLSFEVAEIGFDPVRISDGNSSTINEAIFERLLTYDYLARPARLAPMTIESMPEVSDDGRTYTFRLRKGIYF